MAFNITSSPVWLDIKKVFTSKTPLPRFIYQLKIHTEKDDISVIKLVSYNIIRDYVGANGDYMNVECIMPLGDYALKLFPYRDNLQVSIRLIDVREKKEPKYVPPSEEIEILKYKAIFATDNPSIDKDIVKYDIQTLNNSQVLTVKFQLSEMATLPILISRIYGNHHDKTPEDILRQVLTKWTSNIEVDGEACIDTIDIYPPDNKAKLKNVVIKDGLHLIEFPRYLQEKLGGVYTKGLGTYFQYYDKKLRWYIYPLYDPSRFDKETRKRLIIYDVPKEKYSNIEKTFAVEGDIVSIVITSGIDYIDNNKNNEMNEGAGFKMLDARSIMKKPVRVVDDYRFRASRTETTFEVQASERKDKLNYTETLPTSANSYNLYSLMNMRRRAEMVLKWEHADNTLIYPGMPIKYVTYDGEEVVEIFGNVASTDTNIVSTSKDLKDTPYSVTMAMKLYIERVEKLKEKEPDTKSFGEF